MVKNVLRAITCSLLIFTAACSFSFSPTYKRETCGEAFVGICKKEFSLDVKAWNVGETLWVYLPLDRLMDENNQFHEENRQHINRMFMVLRRMILSIDNPPKFYVFVFSDIKENGADLFYIGYVPDLVKIDFNMISLGQWYERSAFSYARNPKALGDKEGKHFSRTDITMGDLLSFLVRQALEVKFTSSEIKEYFKIHSTDSYFFEGKLGVIFDIEQIKDHDPASGVKLPSPFTEAKETVKRFIEMYEFKDISEIEINDIHNNRQRYYSIPALMDPNE